MKRHLKVSMTSMVALLAGFGHAYAAGFNSGSTGADGTFAPTVSATLTPPDSGIYNFTDVNIPAGVTITFAPNAANTPVIILATGNVTIAGVIDISGKLALPFAAGQTNNQSGGQGGPGGFAGGYGGDPGAGHGGPGQGVGGARGGNPASNANINWSEGGGGGGYSVAGEGGYIARNYPGQYLGHGTGGVSYGAAASLPVIGGSGGAGGAGATSGSGTIGGGGGGGGGALLLAASGAVNIPGTINARGGDGGAMVSCGDDKLNRGGNGGGGSGGQVRILASSIQATGSVNINGGNGGCRNTGGSAAGNGAVGRYSPETMRGGTLSFNGLPSLALTKIGGVNVPAKPTGIGDVELPLTLPNPVTVELTAQNVPLDAIVKVLMVPVYGGDAATVNAAALGGSLANSATTAAVTLPSGPSTLVAHVTYTLSYAMGQAMAVYAMGEQVERVELTASIGGEPQATLITVSGKQYKVSPSVLAGLSLS